jgi:hypothetical protein
MDARGPILGALGLLLAAFTWRATSRGIATIRFGELRRKDQPRFFFAWIIARFVLAAFAVALALSVGFGWWDPGKIPS